MSKKLYEAQSLVLKRIRKKQKLTQRQMARELGISDYYYAVVERGLRPLHSTKLSVLSERFNVSDNILRTLRNSRRNASRKLPILLGVK